MSTQDQRAELLEGYRAPERPSALILLGLGLGAVLIAVLSLLAVTTAAPSVWILVALAVLMLAAEHRDQLFGDETSMSGSIAVGICAAVAFQRQGQLVGPLICGACAGLYWPHLRDHAWVKVAINACSMGFSALAAAGMLALLSERASSTVALSLCLVPAIVTYWLVNSAILGAALRASARDAFPSAFIKLIKSETEMLVFAFAGGICGLVMLDVSTWAGVLGLVVVLVAADVLVISRPRRGRARVRHRGLGAAISQIAALGLAGVGAFLLGDPLGPGAAAVIGAIAGASLTFGVILLVLRARAKVWDAHVAAGVVWVDAPAIAISAIVGSVASSAGLLAAGAVAVIAGATAIAARRWRRRRRLAVADDDALALALVELALLDRPEDATPAS